MDQLEKRIYIEKDGSHQVIDMPKSHAHPYHELYFLLSGERRYLIGHKLYDLLPGNLVLIPQYELHRTIALNNQGYERYVVYFEESAMDPFISYVGRSQFDHFMNSGCLSLPQECVSHIQHSLNQMLQEQKKTDSLSFCIIANLLQNIILTAMRHGEEKHSEIVKNVNKLQSILLYISENYASDITLQDAADMVFMERTYFSKYFKRFTGFGFNEYRTQIRLRAAEKMLQFSDSSVSEISDQCGFSSSNYFSGVFKQMYGISPTDYRKQAGHILNQQLDSHQKQQKD